MDKTFVISQCTTTPNLAIHGSASALVKVGTTFGYKVNGQFGPAFAAADCPSLALATFNTPGQPVVGNLAFDDGTVPVTTNSCRMYTLLLTLPEATENPTATLSWIAGAAFPKHRQASASDVAHATAHNQVEVGYVYIKNESTAVFVPGTTALDASGLTVVYSNNYAQVGQ